MTAARRGQRVDHNPPEQGEDAGDEERADQAADFAASRSNQPTYVDYMQALAQSRMTINFSESSAGGVQQLNHGIVVGAAENTHGRVRCVHGPRSFIPPSRCASCST